MNNDSISREALKEEIQKEIPLASFFKGCQEGLERALKIIDNAPAVEPCKDCEDRRQAEYIRHGSSWHELQALRKFKEEHGRPQGEWIPVSERLPNRNGVYNVTRKLKEGETIYFISDASYFDEQNTWHRDVCVNHGRPYLTDIIAWQEKPEPYKGSDAE